MNKSLFKKLLKPGKTYWLGVEGNCLMLSCKELNEPPILVLKSKTESAAERAYHRYQKVLIEAENEQLD